MFSFSVIQCNTITALYRLSYYARHVSLYFCFCFIPIRFIYFVCKKVVSKYILLILLVYYAEMFLYILFRGPHLLFTLFAPQGADSQQQGVLEALANRAAANPLPTSNAGVLPSCGGFLHQ